MVWQRSSGRQFGPPVWAASLRRQYRGPYCGRSWRLDGGHNTCYYIAACATRIAFVRYNLAPVIEPHGLSLKSHVISSPSLFSPGWHVLPPDHRTFVMQRQYIAGLQARDQVDEIYRVVDKQVRANRQGADYLLLQLMDRTGQISGLRWNAGQAVYETFAKGDYLRVVGTTQLHNGMLQLIVQDFQVVPTAKVNLEDFATSNPGQIDTWFQELRERLTTLSNPDLARLMADYFADESLTSKLRRAPAGVKTHHAYEGGLLRHVLDLVRIADVVAPHYPQLDRDLLLAGVFLHDLGKLEELSFDGELTYSDAGQLLGHLVQGVVELQTRAHRIASTTAQPIPSQLILRLQHMIASHHGQLDHGSPKVPMTIEAIVLHFLDDMDAKVNAATELIESDRNSDSVWTAFHPTLGRKLFKPSLKSPL